MSELDILRKNVFENLQEIQRLNNIINELEKDFEKYHNILAEGVENGACYTIICSPIQFVEKELDKLKELKEKVNEWNNRQI